MKNSFAALNHIVRQAAMAGSDIEQMEIIVAEVRAAMSVEVCSLYIAHGDGDLVLAATRGLDKGAIGTVRMKVGEGLVGIVAKTCHPLNVEDAASHEGYRYFPKTNEGIYHAFLGVPLIHIRQLKGVLVVQEKYRHKFTGEDEAFLITVAQRLKMVISQQPLPMASSIQGTSSMRRVNGVKGSPGIGIGQVHRIKDYSLNNVPDRKITDVDAEIESFHKALLLTRNELEIEHAGIAAGFPDNIARIFSVYSMVLNDSKLLTEVEKEIGHGIWAPGALRRVIAKYVNLFEAMEDNCFKSKAEDIRHIGSKLYANLIGAEMNTLRETINLILLGDLISITDIARFQPGQLVGILCQSGSALSHTVVLANALGIPTIMGLGVIKRLSKGVSAIVDGYQGQVIFNPSSEVEEEYRSLLSRERGLRQDLQQLSHEPAVTPDNMRIVLYANTGLLSDISPGLDKGAEGIGLYRTEIPFMLHDKFPTEEEQYRVYRNVLSAYEGKPVSMRTLDIGGDKILPYFRFAEENPALGWRGIRFFLDNTSILMTQIRAMLRASERLENLQILLPMVSRVSEVDTFKDLLGRACRQLKAEGHHIKYPHIGVMVEVPAAISLLHFFAPRIDFISIGSNDLAQYLLAVDRNNPRVSRLADNLHPAILNEINHIVEKAKQLNLQVGLCGELASDPFAVVLLMGMGIDSLSMNAFNLPKIRWLIRSIPYHMAVDYLRQALKMEHENDIRNFLRQQMCSFKLNDVFPSI